MKIVFLLLVNVVVANYAESLNETIILGASYCIFTFSDKVQLILFVDNDKFCEIKIGEFDGRKRLVQSLISFSVAFKNQHDEDVLQLRKSIHNWDELKSFKCKMVMKIDKSAELPTNFKYSDGNDELRYKFCMLY